MARETGSQAVKLEELDLGYLALFVGMRVNELVLEGLQEAGSRGLDHWRDGVIQHLLGGRGPSSKSWPRCWR